MLDARLEQLGAKRFSGRADINREDWKAVDAWIKAAVEGLDSLELKANSSIAGSGRNTLLQHMPCHWVSNICQQSLWVSEAGALCTS